MAVERMVARAASSSVATLALWPTLALLALLALLDASFAGGGRLADLPNWPPPLDGAGALEILRDASSTIAEWTRERGKIIDVSFSKCPRGKKRGTPTSRSCRTTMVRSDEEASRSTGSESDERRSRAPSNPHRDSPRSQRVRSDRPCGGEPCGCCEPRRSLPPCIDILKRRPCPSAWWWRAARSRSQRPPATVPRVSTPQLVSEHLSLARSLERARRIEMTEAPSETRRAPKSATSCSTTCERAIRCGPTLLERAVTGRSISAGKAARSRYSSDDGLARTSCAARRGVA
mmetsp:Transcript_30334/g.78819  ORF Transcript_30334/g.78819 Transcript_30334/m.78819 type:complete len:290 (+) Transcript_30334:336-1205(+)